MPLLGSFLNFLSPKKKSDGAQRSSPPTLHLDTSVIGPPIYRYSTAVVASRAVDVERRYAGTYDAIPTPGGGVAVLPSLIPPAAIRPSKLDILPITRSVSLPQSTSTPTLNAGPKRAVKIHLNIGSTSSLQEQALYRNEHPIVKPLLSPIIEQDYLSPVSTRISSTRYSNPFPLPSSSRVPASPAKDSPGAESFSSSRSQARPNLFISRPVNRSLSQASRASNQSSTSSWNPPSLPPLDFTSSTTSLTLEVETGILQQRPRLETINAGSSEEDNVLFSPVSRRAESFVTAGNSIHSIEDEDDVDTPEMEHDTPISPQPEPVTFPPQIRRPEPIPRQVDVQASSSTGAGRSSIHFPQTPRSPPSVSESFVDRRWDRQHAVYGPETTTFKLKHNHHVGTPAFWTFWLGFICPFLWLLGGWHFTNSGEQLPRMTFWEFYFNAGYWKQLLCCRRRKTRMDLGGGNPKELRLPRWIQEMQSSETKLERLTDPTRSLRDISFGYPFVARSAPPEQSVAMRRLVWLVTLPNRVLDRIDGVKVKPVRGRGRVIDPWIQRCRYAFCWALGSLFIAATVGCTLLFIHNAPLLSS